MTITRTCSTRVHRAWMAFVIATGVCGGCNSEHGIQPKQGYNHVKPDYRPPLMEGMVVLELPHVDPRTKPVTLPTYRIPDPVKAGQEMAFDGHVEPYDAGTKGTIVRIDVRSKNDAGPTGYKNSFGGTALKNKEGQLEYRFTGRAPKKPGEYEFTLLSIGPTLSATDLDEFLVGELGVE